jgi:beta-aspartyl-peptidase (threonine type)
VIGVLVHGGAGRIGAERHAAVLAACRAGAAAGLAGLAAGGRAVDAVQAAVRALEDEPELNAGVGAVLTRDGTVELDAAIMDGTSARFGAVAAVPDLRRPVDLARAVLDDGEHVMLAGAAAWQFARERGFAPAAPGELVTERQRRRLDDERARRAIAAAPAIGAERDGGTVGAVAVDASGQVAVATSTGGMAYKRPGRIGDSPLPGCGTWADRAGAASATGDGEAIIRVTLTRQIVDAIAAGAAPGAAARRALDALVARTGGSAGAIAVDAVGRFGAAHAAETMPVALAIVDDGVRRSGSWIQPDGLDLVALARVEA